MKTTLTVSLFVPPHNPATMLLERLADVVLARSGGGLALRICHSEALGGTREHFELARSGAVDIAYMIHSATPGVFPLTELAHLPPLADAASGTDALQRLLPEYLACEHAGVHVLFLAANAPMAIHSTGPLRDLEGLRGLRVGHTGRVVAATLEAFGAVPVKVFPLAIRAALAAGTIDATSMTYEAAWVIRLGEAVRHCFELNANTITFGLVMNEARYRSLSPAHRDIVDEVLGADAGRELAAMLDQAAGAGKLALRAAGVHLIEPDPHERGLIEAASGRVAADFIGDLEGQGLPARRVFDLLKA